MLIKKTLAGIVSSLIVATVLGGQGTPQTSRAVANLEPTQGNTAKGTVTFEETGGKVSATAKVSGLKAGKHGFHIHEKGDCSAPDAASAGGHYNPESKAHGTPDAPEHHTGDLGNVEADAKGDASLSRTYDFLSLSGPNSIVGKAVIVHIQEDDFKTQPTGNAGARVACGVIQPKP